MNTIVIEIQLLGRKIEPSSAPQFLAYFEAGANRIRDQLTKQLVESETRVYLAQRPDQGYQHAKKKPSKTRKAKK